MRVHAAMLTAAMLAVSVARGDVPSATAPLLERYPAKVREFAELVERLESADAAARDARWREVYRRRFDDGNRELLRIVRPVEAERVAELADQMVRFDRVDRRSVLRFDAIGRRQGLLAIGPPVTGEFAIEFVGASISDEQCDLSIFCGDTSSGTGFQFGAYNNTRNLLLRGMHEEQGETKSLNTDIDADLLLERGRWYRVRLEVSDGEVRGLVDGRLLGRARLGNRYDPTQPRQPMLYAYDSEIAIEEYRLLSVEHAEATTRPATKPEGLEESLRRLALLLDDDDFRVRESAAELLRRAGTRAVPVLQRLQGTGSLEQQERIREVLSLIENPSGGSRAKPVRSER